MWPISASIGALAAAVGAADAVDAGATPAAG
jgi:hypothetical protein